ncbi:hypothetical protein GLOIN_2v1485334 [Rhizophagus clarus]|uniref:Uncharacterized protein n=1 Tax=Rhizophagus clarus TaxID=94130 RepID=A0A8H3KVW1_9GLOM|nr:hypothetical protein GLOIN_2v1485334 [Rhizophagus clarus]
MDGKTSLAQLLEYKQDEMKNGLSVIFRIQYLSSSFYIVAFASYGHYGAYTTVRGDREKLYILLPSVLHKDNTCGFAGNSLTEEEFSDYFYQFCEMRLQILKEDILFLHNYNLTKFKYYDFILISRIFLLSSRSVIRSQSPPEISKSFIKTAFANMNPKNSKFKSDFFERKMFVSEEYIDFYINDDKHWVVGVLQGGEKLSGHQ